EWIGARDSRGYGNVRFNGRVRKAHCVLYEMVRGPIPRELELDHLCRVPWCVNPSHLELVSHAENVRRGAARWVPAARQRAKRRSPYGHAYTKANTYVQPSTEGRACRTCARERKRARGHVKEGLATSSLDVRGEPLSRLAQVAFTDDIVAVEHRSGLVATHLHRDTLRDSGAHRIAHCGPAQIMNQLPRTSCRLASPLP